MPDISMCCNNNCPMRSICYRFRAIPGQYQTYAAFQCCQSRIDEHDSTLEYDCEFFWDCRDISQDRLRPDEDAEDIMKDIREEPKVFK